MFPTLTMFTTKSAVSTRNFIVNVILIPDNNSYSNLLNNHHPFFDRTFYVSSTVLITTPTIPSINSFLETCSAEIVRKMKLLSVAIFVLMGIAVAHADPVKPKQVTVSFILDQCTHFLKSLPKAIHRFIVEAIATVGGIKIEAIIKIVEAIRDFIETVSIREFVLTWNLFWTRNS